MKATTSTGHREIIIYVNLNREKTYRNLKDRQIQTRNDMRKPQLVQAL